MTWPQDPRELLAMAPRLLSFYAECLRAAGCPETGKEAREYGALLGGLAAQPARECLQQSDLHAAIMNLEIGGAYGTCGGPLRAAYLFGHKEARHAAAELAKSAVAEVVAAPHHGMTIAGNGAAELGKLMRQQWETGGGVYPDGNPNAALQAAPPAPAAVPDWLRQLEWAVSDYDRAGDCQSWCPYCGGCQTDYRDGRAGHKDGCELAAALAAAPECLTCSDRGAVGNILTAEPCPDCTPSPAGVAVPEADMVAVNKDDANNYCRILTALGMEEEGDPVAEVQRLLAAAQAQEVVVPADDHAFDYFVSDCESSGIEYHGPSYERGFLTGKIVANDEAHEAAAPAQAAAVPVQIKALQDAEARLTLLIKRDQHKLLDVVARDACLAALAAPAQEHATQLAGQGQEDARDAARYRFIRDVPYTREVQSALAYQQNAVTDQVIDAAIAARVAQENNTSEETE